MRKTRNTKLNLLSLEDRLSPSVTTMTTPVTGGGVNLSVNGNSAGGDTILVHARAGNQVSVYALPGDQYAAYQANPGPFLIANETGPNQIGAAFFVTGYMAVTTGNAADTVIISIDTGLAMGDVSITTNGGNDNQILQAYNNDHPSVNRVSFSAGAGLTPDHEAPPDPFRSLPHPGETPMRTARALLKDARVDPRAVIANTQP